MVNQGPFAGWTPLPSVQSLPLFCLSHDSSISDSCFFSTSCGCSLTQSVVLVLPLCPISTLTALQAAIPHGHDPSAMPSQPPCDHHTCQLGSQAPVPAPSRPHVPASVPVPTLWTAPLFSPAHPPNPSCPSCSSLLLPCAFTPIVLLG